MPPLCFWRHEAKPAAFRTGLPLRPAGDRHRGAIPLAVLTRPLPTRPPPLQEQDLYAARAFLDSVGMSSTKLIAKIERKSAVRNFESIAHVSPGRAALLTGWGCATVEPWQARRRHASPSTRSQAPRV